MKPFLEASPSSLAMGFFISFFHTTKIKEMGMAGRNALYFLPCEHIEEHPVYHKDLLRRGKEGVPNCSLV